MFGAHREDPEFGPAADRPKEAVRPDPPRHVRSMGTSCASPSSPGSRTHHRARRQAPFGRLTAIEWETNMGITAAYADHPTATAPWRRPSTIVPPHHEWGADPFSARVGHRCDCAGKRPAAEREEGPGRSECSRCARVRPTFVSPRPAAPPERPGELHHHADQRAQRRDQQQRLDRNSGERQRRGTRGRHGGSVARRPRCHRGPHPGE